MINATAEYALRAVVFLASRIDVPVSRSELAVETQVPADYLVKVMRSLDAAEIVTAQRGPGGGYRLVQDPDELTVYDVIAAVAALPRIKQCPLGIAGHINLCPLHARLDEAAELAEAALRATKISEVVPSRSKKSDCTFPTA